MNCNAFSIEPIGEIESTTNQIGKVQIPYSFLLKNQL